MNFSLPNLLPPGRKRIHLDKLVSKRDHPESGHNSCVCVSFNGDRDETFEALLAGLRKILPEIYRKLEDAIDLYLSYGMNVGDHIPVPTDWDYQWAHTGEILMCVYFEECENKLVLSYKWRLNTAHNQNALGMDILAFDLNQVPPHIYGVAVKTSSEGADGKIPSAIYNAVRELRDYLRDEKLNNDLGVISANLHTTPEYRQAFLDWYDPYTQGISGSKPIFIAVPAIVIDEDNWDDRFAKYAINNDFGVPGTVRILCVPTLKELVRKTYE